MTAAITTTPPVSLALMLRALKLPTVARHAEEVARLAEREGWAFERYVHHLVELEIHERRRRRIERYLRDSDLPRDKTLATLDRAYLPIKIAKQLATLCEGAFVERGDNLLAFGLPGRGKTHLVCAIGYELIQRGYRVLFTATYALVQRLLAAKRDLHLEKELAILDGYDVVVCDDLGYVQQNRDEMEVLFTFLAERYERRSVIITSNLVFSEWDRIFKDPMTTAAAIDRLVHHCVILEMTGPSIRVDQAHAERATQGGTAPITTELPTTANPTTPGPTTANPTTPGATTTTTPTATTTTPITPGATTTTSPTTVAIQTATTATAQGATTKISRATTTAPAPTAPATTTTPTTTTARTTETPTTTATTANAATSQPTTLGASTPTTQTKTKNRGHRTEADGEM
jgi:DNA replication protein DnaC